MKEKLQQGGSEKKYNPETEYKRFVWGPIRSFKKGIKVRYNYCKRIIKKMVGRW